MAQLELVGQRRVPTSTDSGGGRRMTYLAMTRGDDRVLTIQASDDLTGADVTFSAKRRLTDGDEDAIIRKFSSDGIELDTDTTIALVSIDHADTVDVVHRVLHWDVQVIDDESKVHTVASGRLAIRPDVTQAGPGS